MLNQLVALPRYFASMILRRMRYVLGRADQYQLLEPRLCLMIESKNLIGKVEGLIATRWMTDAEHAQGIRGEDLIKRYFPKSKE